MKTWKIALVAGLAILATGLLVVSAFAAAARPAITPYGVNNGVTSPFGGGYAGGMMRGGMMGSGYSTSNGYQSGTNGYGRCMGTLGWP